MRKAVVRDWVEAEPKVREWANALGKRAFNVDRLAVFMTVFS